MPIQTHLRPYPNIIASLFQHKFEPYSNTNRCLSQHKYMPIPEEIHCYPRTNTFQFQDICLSPITKSKPPKSFSSRSRLPEVFTSRSRLLKKVRGLDLEDQICLCPKTNLHIPEEICPYPSTDITISQLRYVHIPAQICPYPNTNTFLAQNKYVSIPSHIRPYPKINSKQPTKVSLQDQGSQEFHFKIQVPRKVGPFM